MQSRSLASSAEEVDMMHAAKLCGCGGVSFTGLPSKACTLTACGLQDQCLDYGLSRVPRIHVMGELLSPHSLCAESGPQKEKTQI